MRPFVLAAALLAAPAAALDQVAFSAGPPLALALPAAEPTTTAALRPLVSITAPAAGDLAGLVLRVAYDGAHAFEVGGLEGMGNGGRGPAMTIASPAPGRHTIECTLANVTSGAAVRTASATYHVLGPECVPRQAASPRFFDAFLYDNERDMLATRLRLLRDVADAHIAVEANASFTGRPKPLRLDESADAERVVRVAVTDLPDDGTAWDREYAQRDAILRGLEAAGAHDQDLVLIADADEIPRPQILDRLKRCANFAMPATLSLDMRYYSLAWEGPAWLATVVTTVGQLREVGPSRLRRVYGGGARRASETWASTGTVSMTVVENAGWHLSYFMTVPQMVAKLGRFSHTEVLETLKPVEEVREDVARGRLFFANGQAQQLRAVGEERIAADVEDLGMRLGERGGS